MSVAVEFEAVFFERQPFDVQTIRAGLVTEANINLPGAGHFGGDIPSDRRIGSADLRLGPSAHDRRNRAVVVI